MMQRRQFLSAVAAATTLGCGLNRLAAYTPVSRVSDELGLDWKCQVIETLPRGRSRRAPVVTGVSIQPEGSWLAIVGDDHQVGIYDLAQRIYSEQLDRHTDWVRAVRFSNDGRLLASAGNDRHLMVWDSGHWEAPRIVHSHREAIIDLAFAPDSRMVATVGFGKDLRIYDTATGALRKSLECPCDDMHAIAFSPDGRQLAAGGRSGVIRVWNTDTFNVQTQFSAHRQRIRTIQFGPQRQILSAGDDQQVKITDPNQPQGARALPRHGGKLYAVQILNEGLVATGGSDNVIRIWRIDDGGQVGTLKGHTGTITTLDANQTQLVSGSYDTHVRVWERQAVKTARHADPLRTPGNAQDFNQFGSGAFSRKIN